MSRQLNEVLNIEAQANDAAQACTFFTANHVLAQGATLALPKLSPEALAQLMPGRAG